MIGEFEVEVSYRFVDVVALVGVPMGVVFAEKTEDWCAFFEELVFPETSILRLFGRLDSLLASSRRWGNKSSSLADFV